LQKTHMPVPNAECIKKVAKDYFEKWNFLNCLHSINGKHIRLKCPAKSGSMFFNYKVLLAIVDAIYRFLMVDVEAYEKDSDAGVFSNSAIHQNIRNGSLPLSKDKQLPNFEQNSPFVFIGDEAFPLRTYLLRPYPRRRVQNNVAASYFNYRLSRARMTVECAFGISSAKLSILLKSIETSVHIVKAICLLHNAIIDMEEDPSIDISKDNVTEGNNNLQLSTVNNRPLRAAENVRSIFCEYFSLNKI
ncbi:hypothetical protein B7P43_G16689, partial [Cryptotermes secundus]